MNALELLILTEKQKERGVWLTSDYLNGYTEFKHWQSNGTIQDHSIWENGERNGIRKVWGRDGTLIEHCFYQGERRLKSFLDY